MSGQLTAIEGGKKGQEERDPLKPHVLSRKDGIFWITPKVDKDSGEIINNESWLCSPLEVIGKGQEDREQYLILCWKASGQKLPVTKAIRKVDIGEREGWRILKGGGCRCHHKTGFTGHFRAWIQYLSAHKQEAEKAYEAAQKRWVSLIPESYGEQYTVSQTALPCLRPHYCWGELLRAGMNSNAGTCYSMCLTNGWPLSAQATKR
ncbi:Superfamily II helicase and inactivated derivatives [Yersinia pseudotuberculosis]|nr:hypothetical protein [Yersinia pseudotuberculosis]CNC67379.1 Superfamily II helicase and inactivated derivatives [Yersinia pseudotuberculosis]